jgi:hypothetical protein
VGDIGLSGDIIPSRAQRFVADSVDSAVIVAIGIAARPRRTRADRAARWFVGTAALAAYAIVPVALLGGSPGELAAGLRVVDSRSRRAVGWRQAVSRWVVWVAPGVAVNAASRVLLKRLRRTDGAVAAVVALSGPIGVAIYRRRLGRDGVDRMTRSRVVSIRSS